MTEVQAVDTIQGVCQHIEKALIAKALGEDDSRASSKWGTFGGDHPQDLLPVPTQQFVDTLF